MPERTFIAAMFTASSPEAQNRLSCTPGDRVGQAGGERGGPGDVAALVADRGDDAEHDVVDRGRVERREAAAHLVDQADDQRDRLDLVQRPGRLAPPARGADRVVDVGLGNLRHRCPLLAPLLHTPAPDDSRRPGATVTGPRRTVAVVRGRLLMSRARGGEQGCRSRFAGSSRTRRATPVIVETIVVPDPGPGEAVVKVQACGVCHTDLHYREGGINDEFPFLLGHEAAGIVEAVGEGVTDVAPGDFVILNWRAVVRHLPRLPPRRALVLLLHPQRRPEDDPDLGRGALRRAGHRRVRREDARPRRAVHEGQPRGEARGRRPARLRRDGRHRRRDQHRQASAAATRSPSSAAAGSATPPSPAPGSPARPRSSRSTSTTGSSSGPRSFGATHTINSREQRRRGGRAGAHRRQRRERRRRRRRPPRDVHPGLLRPRPRRHRRARRRAHPGHAHRAAR